MKPSCFRVLNLNRINKKGHEYKVVIARLPHEGSPEGLGGL